MTGRRVVHVCWPGGGLCMYVGLEGGCTCLLARIRIVLGMAGSDRKEGHACLLAWIVMGMAGSSAWP